jgi:hypothetical protein
VLEFNKVLMVHFHSVVVCDHLAKGFARAMRKKNPTGNQKEVELPQGRGFLAWFDGGLVGDDILIAFTWYTHHKISYRGFDKTLSINVNASNLTISRILLLV